MASQVQTGNPPAHDGNFIVVFKQDTPNEIIKQSMEDVKKQGGEIHHEYTTLMRGYSATLPKGFMSQLQGSEHIQTIEPDAEVHTQN